MKDDGVEFVCKMADAMQPKKQLFIAPHNGMLAIKEKLPGGKMRIVQSGFTTQAGAARALAQLKESA